MRHLTLVYLALTCSFPSKVSTYPEDVLIPFRMMLHNNLHQLDGMANGFRKTNLLWKLDDCLHLRSSNEESFLDLCSSGDLEGLRELLRTNNDIDLNVHNYIEQSGLDLAIIDNHTDVITYLISEQTYQTVTLGNGMLYAVDKGSVELAELLLQHCLDESSYEYSTFGDGVTPLMLAAMKDDYVMISFLLAKKYSIELPHSPKCFCSENCAHDKERLSQKRLNTYRALASTALICQTAADPISASFELSDTLRACAEKGLRDEYMELSRQSSSVAVALMQKCRTTLEIQTILHGNRKQMYGFKDLEYARAKQAIAFEQKEFISCIQTQHELQRHWLSDYHHWCQRSKLMKFFDLGIRVFPGVLFLMSIIHWCAPGSALVRRWDSPVHRFICLGASFIQFILILFCHNHWMGSKRGAPQSGLEWVIVLYIQGQLWMELRTLMWQGKNMYFRQKWKIFNLTMIVLFEIIFVMWIYLEIDTRIKGNRDYPRNLWTQYDPMLITEVLYAVVMVFTWWKLFYFIKLLKHLGIMVIALSRMITSVNFFLLVFVINWFGFASSLFSLYQPYEDASMTVNGTVKIQQDSFTYFVGALKTLYWTQFGYYPPGYAELINNEYYENKDGYLKPHVNPHTLTENAGLWIYGIANSVEQILLWNIFISIILAEYDKIMETADIDWKFARSQVWVTFFREGSTLPPPFNIVPSPISVKKSWLKLRDCWMKKNHRTCTFLYCKRNIDEKEEEEKEYNYNELLHTLIQRLYPRVEIRESRMKLMNKHSMSTYKYKQME